MAIFNVLGCCLSVSFFLLSTEMTIADRGFDVIETRLIEDICPYNNTVELFLSATGKQSALRLKNLMTKGYGNCTIVIYSGLTGVIVNLDAGPYRPDAVYEGCKDYIQFVPGYDKTRNCNDKVTSLVSDGNKIMFRFIKKYNGDYLERSCIILTTAYRRGNGRCSDDEFMCGSGECIWKEFQCDGQLNCPDGSDEFGPRSRICRIQVKKTPVTTVPPIEDEWQNTEATTVAPEDNLKSSFYISIFVAILSSFLIIMFALTRLIRKTFFGENNENANSSGNEENSGDNNQGIQNHIKPSHPSVTFRTITVIHPGPNNRPEKNNSSPPPSYRSTVKQNKDAEPPSYSAAFFSKEEGDIPMEEDKVPQEDDALLENEDQGMNNTANPGPPPPYVP